METRPSHREVVMEPVLEGPPPGRWIRTHTKQYVWESGFRLGKQALTHYCSRPWEAHSARASLKQYKIPLRVHMGEGKWGWPLGLDPI